MRTTKLPIAILRLIIHHSMIAAQDLLKKLYPLVEICSNTPTSSAATTSCVRYSSSSRSSSTMASAYLHECLAELEAITRLQPKQLPQIEKRGER
jgi:hypothetical protein